MKSRLYDGCVQSMTLWDMGLNAEDMQRLEINEVSMLQWMASVSVREQQSTNEQKIWTYGESDVAYKKADCVSAG